MSERERERKREVTVAIAIKIVPDCAKYNLVYASSIGACTVLNTSDLYASVVASLELLCLSPVFTGS